MKKIILVVLLLAFNVALLKADPPKKINLSYANGKLKIVAEHSVKDSTKHYIDLINISVDGKAVKVIKPTKQASKQAETQEVEIPNLKAGSKIEVKARCNRGGSKTAELKTAKQ